MSFTFDDIARYPLPGVAVPSSIRFSADGKKLMYLNAGESKKQQLFQLDCESGEETVLVGTPASGGVQEGNLSAEEELRRQRSRMLATGITHYSYNKKTNKIMIPINNNVFLHTKGELKMVAENAITPTFAPNGECIAFVRDGDIFLQDLADSPMKPIQITHSESGKTNGLADYIAQEELERSEGFWFSPDSSCIAYCEVDETNIPEYTIVHQGKDEITKEVHRYPFAGAENGTVRLAVINLKSKKVQWMNIAYGDDDMTEIYIARVFWWEDGSLGAEILNREQSRLDLVQFDINTGERKTIITENSKYWVNLFGEHLHFYEIDSKHFLWISECSGFSHIYLIDRNTFERTPITRGEWVVDEIVGVNKETQKVYFTANKAHPTEKHFYCVSIVKPCDISPITTKEGTHAITVSEDCKYFVDVFSSLQNPPAVSLRSMDNYSMIHSIFKSNDDRVIDFALIAPEIVKFPNRDGVDMYGSIYAPSKEKYGEGPYPTVVYVYGGPGPQVVKNTWSCTANLKLQFLRNKGFLVFMMDNQGSARRGMEFESKIKHAMGTVEVCDQVDGVKWLISQKLTDPDRVGITGWSYGGYMTLLCLMKASEVFKVGVSGAPVTFWECYDTAYTERYMGTPQSNPTGYKIGNVLEFVDKLCGKLLIIHGMLDENVLFRHTACLINKLNRCRKEYDTLFFPDERHMPRLQEDRTHLNCRLINFFEQHL